MFENGTNMAGIYAYTNVPDAIKKINENDVDDIIIGFPKETSPNQRKEQMQQLSEFLETNPPVSRLIFSEGHVPKGNVAALNKEELGILAKGLEKNTTVTGIDLINEETYEKFAETPHAVDYTGSLVIQRDASKIKDKKKLQEYEELREIISPSMERNAQIQDAFYDIAQSVLGAKLVSSVLSDDSITDDDKKNLDFISGISAPLLRQTQQTLLEGLEPENALALSNYWHQPAQQGKIGKEKDHEGKEWPPIFGQKEIEVPKSIAGQSGWQIKTLTTSPELAQEGQDLAHCVGGYTEYCLLGDSHIVSVRNPQKKAVSTIEYNTDYQQQKHDVVQHYGESNNKPEAIPKKIERAIEDNLRPQPQEPGRGLRKFAKKLFKKETKWPQIGIDYDSLAQAKKERDQDAKQKPGGKAMVQLGFNPTDTEKMKRINNLYKDVVAPTGRSVTDHKGKEIENFGSEVRNKLRKNFAKLKNLAQINISPYNIGGKSSFDLEPKKEEVKKEPKNKRGDEHLISKIQNSLSKIFPQYTAEDIKIGKTEQGDTSLALSQNVNAGEMTQQLESIFEGKKPINISHNSEDNSLVLQGASLKNSSDILGGHSRGLPDTQARGMAV